jgi:hypothetical protein
MLGYDDGMLTGERRSRRIAAKRNAHNNEQTRHSYYVRDTYENIAHLAGQIRGGSRRRPWRATKTVIERRTLHAYKLSVKKALLKNEKASKELITKELKQLVDKGVWEVIEKVHLTKKQLKSVIRSSMFLKERFNGDGSFDKLKARLVAGGDGQDKSLYDNLSSPTVAQETVMMVIAIAAAEKRKVASIDITGAYLECEIAEDDEVIMMLEPTLVTLLEQIDPSIKVFRDPSGKLYVKLKRALYGCIQSAKLWYDKLKAVLVADGYVPNDYDGCLFNKTTDGRQQITVAW